MEKSNLEKIAILNRLIEINNCRIEIYEQAARESEGSTMQYLFTTLAQNSSICKDELSNEIRKLGGEPKKGVSASGNIYSAWMKVKIALSNKNRGMILNSCSTGEDINIRTYQDTLAQTENTYESYANLIEKQCSMLKADHDRIRNLSKALLRS
jgi:uncharacterized protein (TIGR02284 family)